VKGFDIESEVGAEGYDDSLDKLDIYAKFLGENEYLKMKENYHKALTTMSALHNVERERMHMNAPITYNELLEQYDQDTLQRFQAVHEAYLKSGKSREKYMQRVEIEFKSSSMTKADYELIDSFFEHKRWVR